MYWVYFHIVGEFTKADLGPLGDFIGGNINPLFTFISTILLIDTVIIQRKAADDSKQSEKEARDTIKQQSDLAAKQSFESSLFNLLNLCLSEYKNTTINLKSGIYTGNQAFARYIDIYEKLMLSSNKKNLLNKLEELSSDALFDNLKNFSTVFKFIKNYAPAPEIDNYISITVTMMPTSLIQLLCVARNHSLWPILASFDNCGVFDRPGVKNYIIYYR
jgi:hypothetical protein